MQKLVNGVNVTIDNLDLFKLAAEGKVLRREYRPNKVQELDEKSYSFVTRLLVEYKNILDSLIYPLDSLETDIKYVCIAKVLTERLTDIELEVEIKNGLLISLNSLSVLRLFADSWCIEDKNGFNPVKELNLDYYSNRVGYIEYKWAYKKLISDEGTFDFYKEFMTDFYKACREQDLVVEWEVKKILEFGYMPAKLDFITNKLVDIRSNVEYFLDVYCSGLRETNESYLSFDVDKDGKPCMETNKKKIKVYTFDVYGKDMLVSDNRMEKLGSDIHIGISSVFDILLEKGMEEDSLHLLEYKGFIDADTLVFQVGNDIYYSTFNDYHKAIKIMSDMELFSYEGGKVYGRRRVLLDSGVYENTIYSYELATEKARLCNIQYVCM